MGLFGRKNSILLFCALGMATLLALSSCRRSDNDVEDDWIEELGDITDPTFPTDPTDGTMSLAEQRERLEKTALAFLNQISASDFTYYKNLTNYVRTELATYESTEAMEHVQEILEQVLMDESSDETQQDYPSYAIVYSEKRCTWLVQLARFRGHYTAKNGKWVYADAKDFQIAFNDQEGKPCTLSVEVGGDTTQILVSESEDYEWWSDTVDGNVVYHDQTTENRYVLAMPEEVRLVFKQQNRERVEIVLQADLESTNGGQSARYLKKLTALTRIDDYQFGFTKGFFHLEKKLEFNWVLRKNDKMLLDIYALMEANLSEKDIHQCKVSLNLMDEVQVFGVVRDGGQFNECLENIQNDKLNETVVKDNVDAANALLDLGLYFDNKTDVKQAEVVMQAEAESEWRGVIWHVEPVIVFGNGISYSYFSTFFEEGFEELVSKFRMLQRDFERLAE